MFNISKAYRYFMYGKRADMRKGFNGLCGLVRNEFLQNPLSGDVFIFINRPRNRIKLLHWQGDGFAIYYKRLEKGTYEMPEINSTSASIELDAQQLLLILEGISLSSVKKRRRYTQHFVDKKPMNTVHSEV
ncbi:MAG: IS66 family insertion sequence element accessory protein TnpB [Bacteroidia bacterium]